METRVVRVDPYDPADDLLIPCAAALRDGALVAFPTETVYGLGANALKPESVTRIFEAKGRPQDNPLIVHVSRLESVAPLVTEISPMAAKLMETFWPGPLTLLFPRSQLVPPVVTAGLPTVAVRMPDHPVAHRLIDLAGVPVAAPSANVSGGPSPTTFDATFSDLNGRVDYIVDGGLAGIGVESTVLDISGRVPVVLRPGGLSVEDLREALGEVRVANEASHGQGTPPSPGMKYKHYAPKAGVWLASGSPMEQGRAITLHALKMLISGKRVAVLSSTESAAVHARAAFANLSESYPGSFFVLELGSRDDLAPVASKLFASLRLADKLGAGVVLAESFPQTGLGLAIQNRLHRASGGRRVPGVAESSINILMVCSGNTCRSPMAEALMRKIWAGESKGAFGSGKTFDLEVWSSGTSAGAGYPASEEAISAMAGRGIDLSSHLSAPVTAHDLERADLVIAMTGGHKRALVRQFPDHAPKVRTLAEVSEGSVTGDVEDPFLSGQEVYDRTAETIAKGLTALARRLINLLGGHA